MPHLPKLLAAGALLALGLPTAAPAARTATLTGRAAVPAGTFAAGPPSGAHITGSTNGVSVPFASQPVQGFSAVIPDGSDGSILGLIDNGYGALENSADSDLRLSKLKPNFANGRVKGDGHTVAKAPLVDELDIANPNHLGLFTDQPGDLLTGDPFGLPFNTIESLQVLDPKDLLIGVDDNFPFSVGRHVGTGKPDDSEFVTVQLPRKVG